MRGPHLRASGFSQPGICRAACLALVTGAVAVTGSLSAQERTAPPARSSASVNLAPTSHPPLPGALALYWLIPEAATRRADDPGLRLAKGAALIAQGDFAAGLPLVTHAAVAKTPLAGYADYYAAVAQQELKRLTEADATLTTLIRREPQGHLRELAVARLAQVALARQDAERAEKLLGGLRDATLRSPQDVFLNLGRVEEAAGHTAHALDAYRRLYYDFPTSDQAADAKTGIDRLETPALVLPDQGARELTRAETLFGARRWAQAKAGFEPLLKTTTGLQRDRIAVRIAQSDHYLDRHRSARESLRPYISDGPLEAEARFFHLTSTRELGDHASYVALARKLVADFPTSDWAAETLHGLATHYIVIDADDDADAVSRELLQKFPRHRHSERAAWKVGWRSYLSGNFAETASIFETAAVSFPRANNRPAWLYWSGRARDQMKDPATANQRYRLTVTDYQNSYYGRLAADMLAARKEPVVTPTVGAAAALMVPQTAVPTEGVIRALLGVELYEDALAEVQYAQRAWGDSPQLQATVAWIRHRQGQGLKATERFNALRGAINVMRAAYPQFMAAGGEQLPPDVLRVIFPLDYWNLITKYASQHKLDPYLMAALMAQESTFTPEIRSSANAYGLMQVIPATGRKVARQLGIRNFRQSMLTQPETNVRLGMKYFKDMVEQFGGEFYALAGYNAGPHRVKRWLGENPGLSQDEFIDNIPFPETQTYVKRILGTAEDYRRLYGPGGVLNPDADLAAELPPTAAPAATAASAQKATAKPKPAAKPRSTATPRSTSRRR